MNILMFYKSSSIARGLVDELYKCIAKDNIYVVVDIWRERLPEWANRVLELNHVVPKVNFISLEQFFGDDLSKISFDYIVGQPPIHGEISSTRSQLWRKIVDKSLTLLSDTGTMKFITPRNMFSGSGSSTHDYLGNKASQPIVSVEFDSDEIEYNRTGLCLWTIDKSKKDFITEIDGVSVNMKKTEFISDSSIVTKIINKVFNTKGFSKLEFNQKGCVHRDAPSSEYKTSFFKYPVDFNGIIKYAEKKSRNHSSHKVIYPRLTIDTPYYSYNISNGDSSAAMQVSNEAEGRNLVSLMNSKLYKWIIHKLKLGSGILSMKMNNLPLIEYVDDSALYQLFSLSKKEIRAIESYFSNRMS